MVRELCGRRPTPRRVVGERARDAPGASDRDPEGLGLLQPTHNLD